MREKESIKMCDMNSQFHDAKKTSFHSMLTFTPIKNKMHAFREIKEKGRKKEVASVRVPKTSDHDY